MNLKTTNEERRMAATRAREYPPRTLGFGVGLARPEDVNDENWRQGDPVVYLAQCRGDLSTRGINQALADLESDYSTLAGRAGRELPDYVADLIVNPLAVAEVLETSL